MAQSLAQLNVHLIFSTKARAPLLLNDVRESFHRYAAVRLQTIDCAARIINSVEDHVHILFHLSRTVTLSAAVQELKSSTSRWLKLQGPAYAKFSWQAGYGAFAVSASNVPEVQSYVANQREHHRVRTFQDEFRSFLKVHEIEYDERYVWD